jgi:hypothetical protein
MIKIEIIDQIRGKMIKLGRCMINSLLKISKFYNFFKNYYFFETTGKKKKIKV